jgi:ABC-type transporter Mla subunit MlaD
MSMLIYAAKNDFDVDGSPTWTQINRLSHLPVVDAHCHIFGQSLMVGDTIHEWSDPTKVTFVKAGTDGEVRKHFKPSVVLLKKVAGSSGDAGGLGGLLKQAKDGLDTVKNSEVASEIAGAVAHAVEIIKAAIEKGAQIRDAILTELRSALASAKNGITSTAEGALARAREAMTALRSTLEATLDSVAGKIEAVAHAAGQAVTKALGSVADDVREKLAALFGPVADKLGEYWDKISSALEPAIEKVSETWDKVVTELGKCVTKCQEVATAVQAWVNDQTESLRERAKSLANEAATMIRSAGDKIEAAFETCKQAVDTAKQKTADAWTWLKDELRKGVDDVKDAAKKMKDQAEELASKASDTLQGVATVAKTSAIDLVTAFMDQADATYSTIIEKMEPVHDAWAQFQKSVNGAYASAKSSANSVVGAMNEAVDLAKGALDAASGAAEDAQQAMQDALGGVNGDELKAVKDKAAELAKRELTKNQEKLFARGVVEVSEADWPPMAVMETMGDNIVFKIEVSDGATVHTHGLGGHSARLHNVTEYLEEMTDSGMAKFLKYMMGDDGENAAVPLNAVPKMGGRAIVPYLLDFGYTPLKLPIPFIGPALQFAASYAMGLPDPMPDPDGYYGKDGEEFMWFDREGFRTTYETLAEVASQYPFEIWPMVPFDPRRPDGLTHVKECIGDFGFAGVKLYSRCGWAPANNSEIHGAKGATLDRRCDELFSYLEQEDLPAINHTSPGGFPINATLVLPKTYDSGLMYHHKQMHPGRVGIGPYPLGIMDLIPDSLSDLLDTIGNPGSWKLTKQAQDQGSGTLGSLAQFAKDAENRGHDMFWTLAGAAERARGLGESELEKLRDYATSTQLDLTDRRAFVEQFIDPDTLKQIAAKTNVQDFFTVALSMSNDELRKSVDKIDPTKSTPLLFSKETFENTKSAAKIMMDPVKLLFETLAKLLAQKVCYEAARYCHYVQHTASPYAWEDVLSAHPKLRLNFAHCGGAISVCTHFDLDDSLEDLEEREKNGVAVTKQQKDRAKLFKELVHELEENPFVAPGAKFKEKLFAKCAARSSLTATLVNLFGSAEETTSPTAALGDLVDEIIRKVLPGVNFHVLARYSVNAIHKAVVKGIDEVLETQPWKDWLDTWEETYPDGWFKKINTFVDEYDNVYTDMAYLDGGETEVFETILGKVRDEASPGNVRIGFTDSAGSQAGNPAASGESSGDETAMADKMLGGTDWFMIEMDDLNAQAFWGRIQRVVDSTHPLHERWISRNACDWMNLSTRMDGMEAYYKKMTNDDELKPPKWWHQLKAYYERNAQNA